jgi:peptide/nickel transport system permease protein
VALIRYILRRLFFLVFLMIGVSLMIFIITSFVPSDPVVANLSQRNLNDPEMVAAFQEKWGLDKPLHIQYFTYLKNLTRGDLGTSIRTNNPVLHDLKQYFPATMELALFSMIIAIVFGVAIGIISAVKRNTFTDQFFRAVSVFGVSVPSFWLALVMLYVFYYKLGITPGLGRIGAFHRPLEPITNLLVLDALIYRDGST